ncbi:MAG: MATE family efflux transporter [Oscillospiraceae bacterium]
MPKSLRGAIPDENQITQGVIWKQLLLFFFPILLGTFFQQLYNTVDAVIVGNFVGKEALAAVGGATGTLINLIVGFFVGLSSGATVIISQFFGARRAKETSQAVHTAMALAIAAGAVFMVVGIAAAPWALRAMGTPADIMEHAVVYLRVYFAGMIFSLVYNIGSGILRAIGDSKRPLYFLIVCSLLNLVLDLLFVLVFRWGVLG